MSGPGIAYSAALVLAVVFAGAGVAKLRRRATTARTFAALGLTSPGVLAVGVPSAELALAVGLVVAPAWAGIASLAVLAGFTTFLVQAMRRGDALACGCFGATRPTPVGGTEIVRNAALAVAATAATLAHGPLVPGLGDVVTVLSATAAAWAVVSAVGRRVSPPPSRSGPPVGSVAPLLGALRYQDHRRTVLAFVAPTCAGCAELRRSVAHHDGPDVRVEVVELDDASATDFAAFEVRATPFVVVVDDHGRVQARGPARSESDVAALIG